MGRTASISDEQILEAAREVFMEHGVRASTALLAERAGVSEGTLFKRFTSKEALFAEAMTFDTMARLAEVLDIAEAAPSIDQALEGLIVGIAEKLRSAFPRMMLMWASVTPQAFFRSMESPPPLLALSSLEGWVRRQRDAGALSALDPEVFARLILGACHHFVFLEVMGLTDHPGHRRPPLPLERYAQDVTRTLLDGHRGAVA